MKHFFYFIVAALSLAVAVPTDEDFQALSARVATLEARVAKLEEQPQPPPASTSWFASPPTADSDLTIPAGKTIVLDGEDAIVRDLTVAGTLQIAGDKSTSLSFRTIRVEPTGAIVGNVPWPHTCTLSVRNLPLMTADSNGIICEGKFHLRGAGKECGDNRPSVEPLAGRTTLTFAGPCTGWQSGDKLFVPGSRQLSMQNYNAGVEEWEDVTVSSVAGNVVTLANPLAYSHPGARNSTGSLEFMAAVQNLSRNVTIRSESANGVRGHVLFKGRADVDVRYCKFVGLGRKRLDDPASSAPGVHFHHCYGPETPQPNGYQYTFIGNAITCPLDPMPFMWGLAIHDSHFGLIQNNDINNWAGAGLVVWDGSETQNVIEGNRVMRINGNGERIDSLAMAGTGYWLRGPDNFVRNNVAANMKGGTYNYGFNLFGEGLGDRQVPAFQGADKTQPDQSLTVNMALQPLREFAGNEVFATRNGLTYWWIGCQWKTPGTGESVIRDLKFWHIYNWGIFGYHSNRLTVENLVSINVKTQWEGIRTAITFTDYFTRQFKLVNSRIEKGNIRMPTNCDVVNADQSDPEVGKFTIADVTMIGGVISGTPPASVTSAGLSKRYAIIRNVMFPGTPATTIVLSGDPNTTNGEPQWDLGNAALIENYRGVQGDTFLLQPIYRPPLPNPLPDRAEITGKLFQP